MQNLITNFLPDHDNYIIGFADMEDLLAPYFPFRYAVVIGVSLNDEIIDNIEKAPTEKYYNLYHQTNNLLNDIVIRISSFLNSRNIDSRYIPASKEDLVPGIPLRNKYSHKMAATRAGIGWIGKTDLLVSRKFGPRLRLASVLTNYKFEYIGNPVTESECGSCTVCVEKCPAKAATGKLWNVNIDRDEFFSTEECKAECRRRSMESLHKEISLCGVCVSVCPIGITA